MRKAIAGLLFLICGSVSFAQSGEQKRLTMDEVEKELALAEAYLTPGRNESPVDAKPVEFAPGHYAVANVVRNISSLPENSDVRLKAIALARKYAAIPEYAIEADLRKQTRPEGVHDHHAHARLRFAWGVLRETGVLRDGMRLEEYVGLLGQPTKIGRQTVEWYYSSKMHVNPCLRLWKVDGREKKGRVEQTRY